MSIIRATLASSLLLSLSACARLQLPADTGLPEDQADGGEEEALAWRVLDADELDRMQRYLDQRLDLADVVSTEVTDEGDTVDCVVRERQPALRRAGRQNEPLQLQPGVLPDLPTETHAGTLIPLPRQVCPEGTVPMMHLRLDDLARFETLDDFFRKTPYGDDEEYEAPRVGSTNEHQYGTAIQSVDNIGEDGYFNVWKSSVERSDEFSLSQLWEARGSGTGLQSVELGWQVFKDRTGDSNPHLFIYSTQDGYNATGCYDLTCSDFVQVSGSVTPGMTLSPVSTSGGTQYEAHLLSYRDPSTGNWWLQYQGVWIGYYPKSLYSSTGLLNRSSRVNVGGEIIDENSSRHTTTDMGSGAFSSSWYHYAAYVRDIKYIDTSNTWQVPTSLSEYETDSNCYDATVGSESSVWGYYLFFGGTGYNSSCT